MSNKRTRSQVQSAKAIEQKKDENPKIRIDDLYAAFTIGKEVIYVPVRSVNISYNAYASVPPSVVSSRFPYCIVGIKRGYFTVYLQLGRLCIYKKEAESSVSFKEISFTNVEEKKTISVPINMCNTMTTYADGAQFSCKFEDLHIVSEIGEKPFKLSDCFIKEEFSRITPMILQKRQKKLLLQTDEVEDISQPEEKKDVSHLSMYT